MIPVSFLYDEYIDRPRLTEQKKTSWVYSSFPLKRGRNKNQWNDWNPGRVVFLTSNSRRLSKSYNTFNYRWIWNECAVIVQRVKFFDTISRLLFAFNKTSKMWNLGNPTFLAKCRNENGYNLKFKNRSATSDQHVYWLAFEHHLVNRM